MIQARERHAAGIVTDEATQGILVVVTGGYYYFDTYQGLLSIVDPLQQFLTVEGLI